MLSLLGYILSMPAASAWGRALEALRSVLISCALGVTPTPSAAAGPARRDTEAQLTSRYAAENGAACMAAAISPRKVPRWKGSAIVSTPSFKPGGDEYACADDDHIDD